MKWLITGGCGFIGRNLIKNLMEEGGHFIRVMDDLSVGTKDDLSNVCNFTETKNSSDSRTSNDFSTSAVRLIVGSILDEKTALDAAKDMDVIVHLAANTGVGPSVEDPRSDCLTNVIGTLNFLEAARLCGVKRFVFASSGAPIGNCSPPIHEELAPHPVSPYGASKLAGEGYCSAYFGSFGVETVALRFGNVYGPFSGHKASVIAKFIKRVIEGKTLEIYGDGEQTRDFVFVEDLVNAIRLAAIKPDIGGEIFQIASNKELSVEEMAVKLRREMGTLGFTNIDVRHTETRIGDVKRNFSNTAKAANILDWQLKTDFETGLKKTIQWFLERQNASEEIFPS